MDMAAHPHAHTATTTPINNTDRRPGHLINPPTPAPPFKKQTQGAKEFFLAAPTDENIWAFEKWVSSRQQVGTSPRQHGPSPPHLSLSIIIMPPACPSFPSRPRLSSSCRLPACLPSHLSLSIMPSSLYPRPPPSLSVSLSLPLTLPSPYK